MKKLNVIIIKEKEEDINTLLNDLKEFDNDIVVSIIDNDFSKNGSNLNKIINKEKTEYVMFIRSIDDYNYKNVIKKFLNHEGKNVYFINYYSKDTQKIKDKTFNNDNLGEYSNKIKLSIFRFIFKRSIIKDIKFSDNYNSEEHIDFPSAVIENEDKIYILNNVVKRRLPTNNHNFMHNKDWYIKSLEEYVSLIKKYNKSRYIKYCLLNLLCNKFMLNLNSKDNHVLNDDEIKEFEKLSNKLLSYIDDDIINEYFDYNSHHSLFYTIMTLKHTSKKVNLGYGPCHVEIIDFENNKLIIEIKLPLIDRSNKEKVYFNLNGKKIIPEENKVYSKTKFFGKVYQEARTFRCEISIDKFEDNNKISIKISDYQFPLFFSKPMSKVSEKLKYSHYNFKEYTLKYDNDYICINKTNRCQRIINELKFQYNILFSKEIKRKKFLHFKSFGLRILYWLTKPFFRKEIWIAYDKLYKGGDNGEYFFHYAYEHDKTRKIYYVINKNANDYKRLKKNKNILKYRSIKHYLCVLNARAIFSTHANPFSYNGFATTIDLFFRDLLTFDVFCIQHGLSVNQIAKFQNRVYANTKLYFCASNFEIKNLKDESYDYKDNQLLLTGIPRFDGLKDDSKKQILITPTWRQYVAANTEKLNQARGYSSEFKDSNYYKIYLSLITNKKLVDCAKKHNYKIIYLLHPAVAGQIDDFPKDIYTKVIPSTGNMSYEKILRESNLMVTDYSGVQFDFAYMKKPIVYYHPKDLPPHYEEGGLIYDKEGFGPIIEKENELVEYICKLIENDCKNEKKYVERTNKFFAYSDHNTCKRIYDEVNKYYKNIK